MNKNILLAILFTSFLIMNLALAQPTYKTTGKITDTVELKFTYNIPSDYSLFVQYRTEGTSEWKYVKSISLFITPIPGGEVAEGRETPLNMGITKPGTYEFRIIGFEENIQECEKTPNNCIESNYLVLTIQEAVVAACSSNADCDDKNPCTEDVCVNPATASSSCSNTKLADGSSCATCKRCSAGNCINKDDGYNDCGSGCQRCVSGSCEDYNEACKDNANSCFCSNDVCKSCPASGCCDAACSAYSCKLTPNNANCPADKQNCVNCKCVACLSDANCLSDGWYDTGKTKWVDVSTNTCKEKEQKEQENRNYVCSNGACSYSATSKQWIDTGNTRNKPASALCSYGNWYCKDKINCDAYRNENRCSAAGCVYFKDNIDATDAAGVCNGQKCGDAHLSEGSCYYNCKCSAGSASWSSVLCPASKVAASLCYYGRTCTGTSPYCSYSSTTCKCSDCESFCAVGATCYFDDVCTSTGETSSSCSLSECCDCSSTGCVNNNAKCPSNKPNCVNCNCKACASNNDCLADNWYDTGTWSCDGSCKRCKPQEYRDYSCNLASGECKYTVTQTRSYCENAPNGQHCSAGSFTSTDYCGSSSAYCADDRYKKIDRYECDGNNNCNVQDSTESLQDCGLTYYDCKNSCVRNYHYTCSAGSCGSFSSDKNCPKDTSCSAGDCKEDKECSTGNYECKDSCTKGQKQYRCDGSGNCNALWQWTNTASCDIFACSAGSCTNTCEADCGADLACDGKTADESCGTEKICDSNCKCVSTPCNLVSASISANCNGGSSTNCEQDETITMSGTYTGDCSAADFFQIDARSADGTCDIQYSDGDMRGMQDSNIIVRSGSVSGSWTIPAIASDCFGKTVSATAAILYDGGAPETGTSIDAAETLTGSFKFMSIIPVCSGFVSLTLNPSSVVQSDSVTPSASGLSDCDGKTVYFKKDSCTGTQVSSCSVSGSGCTGASFTAPNTAGNYIYYACVDGKENSATLTVSSAQPTCASDLAVTISGTGTCTVTAVIEANGCNGKSWSVRESSCTGTAKCSGTVTSSPYSYTCPTWSVSSGASGATYNYVLCIDGEQKSSKSVICTPTTAALNQKDSTKYSNKQVFLISDKDWKNVLSLVPVAVWTDKNGAVNKYPLLIYHDEGNSFDADSIIYFFQQYTPDKIIIVGDTPGELDNLLTALPEIGAGLNINQIFRISPTDYVKYWSSTNTIVAVDYNNYESSLMASTFASYINAPIIFVNSGNLDSYKDLINNKKVYVIDNLDSSTSSYINSNAKEIVAYTLSQLQKEYLRLTNTDKIILVNPNDLNIKITEPFDPEKSSNPISELYSKTSLAASILASAKYELIISTTSTDYQAVDSFIENKISGLGIKPKYLTILASPDAIQMTRKPSYYLQESPEHPDKYEELDRHIYADFNGDYFSDIAVGRITSLTPSDISAYINRVLFYNQIPHSNQFATLWYPNFISMLAEGKKIDYLLSKAGFVEHSVYAKNAGGPDSFNPEEDFENKFYINYLNHGWYTGGVGRYDTSALRAYQIWLSPSIVVSNACGTCGYDYAKSSGRTKELFCANILRRGALAHIGAVELASTFSISHMLLEKQMQGYDIGTAFRLAENQLNPMSYFYYEPVYVLFGDPTINLNLNYPSGLEMIKTEINTADNYLKISFPKNPNKIYVSFDGTETYVFRGQIGDSLVMYWVQPKLNEYGWSGWATLSLSLGEFIKNIKKAELILEGETITLSEKSPHAPSYQFVADKYEGHELKLTLMRDNEQRQWIYVYEYLYEPLPIDGEFIPDYSYKIYYEEE